MSKYTTEVRYICESQSGLEESKGFNNVEDIINASVENIFNFNFPIFDEEYRIPLEKKILRHYYTREICEETVGLWKLRLNIRLNDIMPYYNQLYTSTLLEFNPLYDVDLTTTHQKVNNGTDSLTNTHNDTTTIDRDTTSRTVTDRDTTLANTHEDEDNITDWDVYSDTPQGALTNVDNNTYLTNARKKTTHDITDGTYSNIGTEDVTNTGTGTEDVTELNSGGYTNSGTSRDVEDYLQHVVGKTPGRSYSAMLKEFRETFLNIDMLIIDELSDLFFGLWE